MEKEALFESVSLPEMLAAREARAARQKALLQRGGVLLCLTMNIPGPQKTSPLILQAFFAGVHRTERALAACGAWERAALSLEKTGAEAYYRVFAPAESVKRAMCAAEDEPPLGRLFDLDVLLPSGEKVSREQLGLPPRACLLCGKPAFVCARSRAHAVPDMTNEIIRRIEAFKASECARIGALAADALCREALTTPKPGLVDRRNPGSHPDMTLTLLMESAHSLEGYFAACAAAGADAEEPSECFEALRALGLAAERRMLSVTGGVNTHKGAAFSLGILCAAAGYCAFHTPLLTAEGICVAAGKVAAPAMTSYFAALTPESACTYGERLYLSEGIRGIRGEAADGFPTLREVALPKMRALLSAGEDENTAGVCTLLALIVNVTDTTLLKRGGAAGAVFARENARKLLEEHAPLEKIEALDDAFVARNLTCGGCADLLACAFFLLAFAE